MKFTQPQFGSNTHSGFTLPEMAIAATVLAMTVIALVAVQIFALRVYTLAATKLSATAGARKALNEIRDQIRNAYWVDVGNYTQSYGDPTNFNSIADGQAQIGNALRILPDTTNFTATIPYTLVYLQPGAGGTNFATQSVDNNNVTHFVNTNSLIVVTYDNGAITSSNVVASYITNQYLFQAQDFRGNILSQNQNNRIVQIQMFFSQWEYPIALIGTNNINAYDYYRLQTRVTRRAIE